MDIGDASAIVAVAPLLALSLLVLFQTLVAIALLRELAELRSTVGVRNEFLQEDSELPVGSPAPSFSGLDIRSGTRLASGAHLRNGGIVILLSPDCSQCERLAKETANLSDHQRHSIVAVCKGSSSRCLALGVADGIPLVRDSKIAALYRVVEYPTVIAVSSTGRVVEYAHPRTARQLESLISSAVLQVPAQADYERDAARERQNGPIARAR